MMQFGIYILLCCRSSKINDRQHSKIYLHGHMDIPVRAHGYFCAGTLIFLCEVGFAIDATWIYTCGHMGYFCAKLSSHRRNPSAISPGAVDILPDQCIIVEFKSWLYPAVAVVMSGSEMC